jgi:hypothetical protein
MNNGVAIAFAVIFVLVSIIGLVLFKEARTHRHWRHLVENDDLRAIRGILDAEMDHWRTMRPPKGINSTMWAGVQAMELIGASARTVHLSTSAAAEFRVVEGQQTQVATALDTAMAVSARLIEMIFYDLPHYRPETIRVDVYTTFRSVEGGAVPHPILSVDAERGDAMAIDWDEPNVLQIIERFQTVYSLSPEGEPRPIDLPLGDPDVIPVEAMDTFDDSSEVSDTAGTDPSSETGSGDRSAGVR